MKERRRGGGERRVSLGANSSRSNITTDFFIRQTSYANTVAIKSKLPFSFHGLLNYTHAEIPAWKIKKKINERQNVREHHHLADTCQLAHTASINTTVHL